MSTELKFALINFVRTVTNRLQGEGDGVIGVGKYGPLLIEALNAEPTAGRFEKTPDVPFFTREQLNTYANNSRNEFTSLEMQLAQALFNEIKHRRP